MKIDKTKHFLIVFLWSAIFAATWCLSVFFRTESALSLDNYRSINLLNNGGFEIGSSGQPFAWTQNFNDGRAVWTIDNEMPKNHLIKLHNDKPQYASWRSDLISVNPGTALKISARLRTLEIRQGTKEWHGVGIVVRVFDDCKKQLKYYDLVRKNGTTDWSNHEMQFIIPKSALYLDIICLLQEAVGTAWIDDIAITAIGRFIGYKISDSPFKSKTLIGCDINKIIGMLSSPNGLYYVRSHGAINEILGLDLNIVRLGPLTTQYRVFRKRTDVYDWAALDHDIANLIKQGVIPYVNIAYIPEEIQEDVRNGDFSLWKKFVGDIVRHYSSPFIQLPQ